MIVGPRFRFASVRSAFHLLRRTDVAESSSQRQASNRLRRFRKICRTFEENIVLFPCDQELTKLFVVINLVRPVMLTAYSQT